MHLNLLLLVQSNQWGWIGDFNNSSIFILPCASTKVVGASLVDMGYKDTKNPTCYAVDFTSGNSIGILGTRVNSNYESKIWARMFCVTFI